MSGWSHHRSAEPAGQDWQKTWVDTALSGTSLLTEASGAGGSQLLFVTDAGYDFVHPVHATGFLADKAHFFPFVVGVVLGCAMPSVPNFAAVASRLLSLCWGATSLGIKVAPEPVAASHGAEKSSAKAMSRLGHGFAASAEVALPEFGRD